MAGGGCRGWSMQLRMGADAEPLDRAGGRMIVSFKDLLCAGNELLDFLLERLAQIVVGGSSLPLQMFSARPSVKVENFESWIVD